MTARQKRRPLARFGLGALRVQLTRLRPLAGLHVGVSQGPGIAGIRAGRQPAVDPTLGI